MTSPPRPDPRRSLPRLLGRGLVRRCPLCGGTGLFEGYVRLRRRCPTCGLGLVRLDGQWSGDVGINTVVTFALLWIILLGGTLVMWGHVRVGLLAGAAALAATVFPVLFAPTAKTLWLAIDLAMRPPGPGEPAGPPPPVHPPAPPGRR